VTRCGSWVQLCPVLIYDNVGINLQRALSPCPKPNLSVPLVTCSFSNYVSSHQLYKFSLNPSPPIPEFIPSLFVIMNHFNICFVHLPTNSHEIHSWDDILTLLCFLFPKSQKRLLASKVFSCLQCERFIERKGKELGSV
jgi:hypothetical protein